MVSAQSQYTHFLQDTRRRFVRMIPEGCDSTRAFIGWTWKYPYHARFMLTWPWKEKWHRFYFGFSFSAFQTGSLKGAIDFYPHESWPITPTQGT